MLPNFIYIGPDKAGSTWIFEALRAHPDVYVAPSKDIYFFDRYFDRGLQWYERHFAGAGDARAVGEISHDYLFSKVACERIATSIRGVKLLATLRNPVERAFSEYLYYRKHGAASYGLRRAAEEYPSILTGGLYAAHLEEYLRRFPRDALLLQRFDTLQQDPSAFAAELYDFLGVDTTFKRPGMERKSLPASRPRAPGVARLVKSAAVLVRELGFGSVVGSLKHSRVVQRALYAPYSERDRPELSSADRRWLRDFYRPDIEALQRLLSDRFDSWLSEE